MKNYLSIAMKTILVVDDDESVRKLVAASLRKTDYRVVQAETGQQAIDLAKQEKPDLILMDIILPSKAMNGIDVTKMLKDMPGFEDCVVLLMSGRETPGGEDFKEIGASDFFKKPFSPVALRQKIGSILQETA